VQGSHESTRVITVRVTERLAEQIDQLVADTHQNANSVMTMLLSVGLKNRSLRAAFRMNGDRGGRR
jgi:hypothetical protein